MDIAAEAAHGLGVDRRRRRSRVIGVALVASTAGFAFAASRCGRGSNPWREFDEIGQAAAAGVACLAALWAARRASGRTVLGWTLVAAGLACWALAEILWSIIRVRANLAPSRLSICDAFFLAADVFLVIGVMMFAVAPMRGRSQLRGLLELLTISGAALLAGWALVFRPTMAQSIVPVLAQLANLSHPVFDIAMLSALLFAVARRSRVARGNMLLVVCGLAWATLTELCFWFVRPVLHYPGFAVRDAGWVGGFLVLAVAALTTSPEPAVVDDHSARYIAVQALPEVALFICTTAIVAGRAWGAGVRFDSTFMLVLVALLAISVLLRLTLVVDNQRLTDGLEERVQGRTEELSLRERYFRSMVQRSSDVITVVDPDMTIRDVTDSVSGVFGWDREASIGRNIARHADEFEDLLAAIQACALKPGGVHRTEWSFTNAFGEVRYVESTIADMVGDPDIKAYVINSRDITERAVLEAAIREQAFHDSLTSLANRALYRERTEHALPRARSSGTIVGVMLIDVDGFKTVNDSLGHAAGDCVLRVIAERLAGEISSGNLVARLGGDEFAVLLPEVASTRSALARAERLLPVIRQVIELDGQSFHLSASIGVVVSDAPGASVESMIHDADIAMYACKRDGKDQARLFQPSMRDEADERFHLEAELRGALDRGEILLHFQPTVELSTGKIDGFEALVRWMHPRLGLLMPDRFVAMAEETGLIVPLGRWILREAAGRLATWNARRGAAPPLSMGINVSPRQLHDGGIVDDVAWTIHHTGVEPSQLILELTEGMLIDDLDDVLDVLARLRALGVRLAIDDFGTGYASLSYLRRMPVQILKVDKLFVSGAEIEGGPRLLQAILSLGRTLGLRVVAEGIEQVAQLDALRAGGCEGGQGYLFSRPLPPADIETLLSSRKGELVG